MQSLPADHGPGVGGRAAPPASPLPADLESFVAAVCRDFGADPATATLQAAFSEPAEVSRAGDAAGGPSSELSTGPEQSHSRMSEPAPPRFLDLIKAHLQDRWEEGGKVVVARAEVYANGVRRVTLRPKEITQYGGQLPLGRRGVDDRIWSRVQVSERSDDERRAGSVHRAKTSIRQRCLAQGIDRMLTLTYRENVVDRERCEADFARYCDLMQARGLLKSYVAVPERQTRGAWHVHIAIRGYLCVQVARRLWHQVVGGDNGNVDIAMKRNREIRQAGPAVAAAKCAAYIGKYVGKAVKDCPKGARSYWATRRWAAPIVERFEYWGNDLAEVLVAVMAVAPQASLKMCGSTAVILSG